MVVLTRELPHSGHVIGEAGPLQEEVSGHIFNIKSDDDSFDGVILSILTIQRA